MSEPITDETLAASIRPKIHALLDALGLKSANAADRCGISRSAFHSIYHGDKTPNLVSAAKIARGLGVTVSYLIGETPASTAKKNSKARVA